MEIEADNAISERTIKTVRRSRSGGPALQSIEFILIKRDSR